MVARRVSMKSDLTRVNLCSGEMKDDRMLALSMKERLMASRTTMGKT